MKKTNKRLICVVLCIVLALTLCACGEADIVSRNVSKEADNFNVMRRITVFNIRTDTVLMQMMGYFSLKNNSTNELVVIAEVEKGVYEKHFVYLNAYTMYIVEDLNGTEGSPYRYELEFLPQMLVPVRITANEIVEDFTGAEHEP